MSMTLEIVAQRVEVLEKQMAMLLADKTDTTEAATEAKPKKEKKLRRRRRRTRTRTSPRRSALAIASYL